MCGIAGLSIEYPLPPKVLADIICELLCGIEERGHDASGIAIYYDDGKLYLRKAPILASRLAEMLPYDKLRLEHARYILLHARAASQGDPSDNENNHPLYCWAKAQRRVVCVVHNGIVHPTEAWIEEYIEREVDSDAFLAGVRRWGALSLKVIRKTLRAIGGTGAVAWSDGYKLILFRDTNPIATSLIQDPGLALVFASTGEILKSALDIDHDIFYSKPKLIPNYTLIEYRGVVERTSITGVMLTGYYGTITYATYRRGKYGYYCDYYYLE